MTKFARPHVQHEMESIPLPVAHARTYVCKSFGTFLFPLPELVMFLLLMSIHRGLIPNSNRKEQEFNVSIHDPFGTDRLD